MNFTRTKRAYLPFLLIFILSTLNVSCEFPDQQPVETIVSLTLTAVASEQTRVALHVNKTVMAMGNIDETTEPSPILTGTETVQPTISTPSSVPRLRVKAQYVGVNVREGPNTCFKEIAILRRGLEVSVLGRNTTRSWHQIQLTNGVAGWVWADYTELIDPELTSQIPLVSSIPRCPTATPLHTATTGPPTATPHQPAVTPPTIGPTPTLLPPTQTPEHCAYPYCPPPTVASTPTPPSCGYYPCP